MRIIGITGGIGCGKSTVLSHLQERYGAVILETDRIAHHLMEPGQSVYAAVVGAFGTDIRNPADGSIDRKALGAIVFADPQKLARLNALTHPAVKAYVRGRIAEEKEAGSGLLVIESALLLADHYEEICDEVWYVRAPETVREKRLMESRGLTGEKIASILNNQPPEQAYLDGADVVIDNGGTLKETAAQIARALNR